MKILCIDLGSSYTKWGIATIEDKIIASNITFSASGKIEKEKKLPRKIINTWKSINPDKIMCAGPQCKHNTWKVYLKKMAPTPYYMLNYGDSPLTINYKHPSNLGIDRIASTSYAWEIAQKPALVLSAGTATTMTVAAHNEIHGGWIVPGLSLSRHAITNAFPQFKDLPKMNKSTTYNNHIIGNSTAQAIHGGIIWQQQALLEKTIRMVEHKWGETPITFLTGGNSSCFSQIISPNADENATQFSQSTTPTIQHDPYLVLKGILWIARRRL